MDTVSTSWSLDSTETTADDAAVNCDLMPYQLPELPKCMGDFGLSFFAPLLDVTKEEPDSPFVCSTTPAEVEDDVDEERSDKATPRELFPLQIAPEPSENIRDCPPILTKDMIQTLREQLPYAVRDNIWERVFAIGLHGDSFLSMTRQCQSIRHSVVVIRTTAGEILGGYVNEEWSSARKLAQHTYYGSGQSFVFGSSSATASDRLLQIYRWTGHNDYCQFYDCQSRRIGMGGAGDFGWFVSDDFLHGQTGFSGTFGNPPLASSQMFDVQAFEVYGLVCPVVFDRFATVRPALNTSRNSNSNHNIETEETQTETQSTIIPSWNR